MSADDKNTPPDSALNGLEKAVDRLADAFDRATNFDSKPKAAENGPAESPLFFKAVKNNHLDDVRTMIAQGVDPNAHDKNGLTALHIAARENLGEMIATLIDAGALPHLGKKNDPQATPIEDAVNYGSNEAVTALARLGGFVPGQRVNGWSLLHRATEKGKTAAVAALLAAGADSNERTESGATPLLIAVQRRQQEVAALLLDHESVIDGMNVIFAETDESKRNAFHLAIERWETAVVEKMIAKGAFINAPDGDGVTPLEKAARNGNLEVVRLLVQAGADLNKAPAGRELPLMVAITSNEIPVERTRVQIISFLLAAGTDPDAVSPLTGMTPLHAAVLTRDGEEFVRALLQYPVNLEARDHKGFTPLFHAVSKNWSNTLELLLERGANPNARSTEDASTPLIHAARIGALPAAGTLLKYGANPALCDAANKSALSYAREKADDKRAVDMKNKNIISILEKALQDRRTKERQRMEKKKAPKNGEWKL